MSRLPLFARLVVVLALCLMVPACKSKLTKENYAKVAMGMSLEEVEKILGKGSKETGDGSAVAGQFGVAVDAGKTVGGGDTYIWETSDKTIRITFRQNKVVHKDPLQL